LKGGVVKLSVVIPCYNEQKNIPLILEKFKRFIRRKDVEVILVNNGSTDNTDMVLNQILWKYPFARSVLVRVNRGYGFGILSGLREARGEYIGWTHADLQTDPGDVLKALAVIEGRGCPADIYVKGLRRGRGLFDNIFTGGMSVFETVYLGYKLWDINAQPNIFPKSFFAAWENPPLDFALDLYAFYMARRLKLEIVRFDVVFPPRVHGHSHWNTGLAAKWKFIRRTVDFSVKLKREIRKTFSR
jgi:glycosyltransferase involved in cell wall biosynthesis